MLLRVLLSMFIVFSLNAIAQNKKVNVSYITEEIKLDAVLNEASWYKKNLQQTFGNISLQIH
jgi:hypothetical protein